MRLPPLPVFFVLLVIVLAFLSGTKVGFQPPKGFETPFWVFTHFLLYFFIGIVHPDNYLFFTVANVLWEGLEYVWSFDNDWYTERNKKILDVVFGLLGYVLGSRLSRVVMTS